MRLGAAVEPVIRHVLDKLRADPNRKGFVPVQLGLLATVKYFGCYKAGWIRDGVVLWVQTL